MLRFMLRLEDKFRKNMYVIRNIRRYSHYLKWFQTLSDTYDFRNNSKIVLSVLAHECESLSSCICSFEI